MSKLENDALGTPVKQNQDQFEAKEVKGAARKAVNLQIGDTAIPAKSSEHVSETEV